MHTGMRAPKHTIVLTANARGYARCKNTRVRHRKYAGTPPQIRRGDCRKYTRKTRAFVRFAHANAHCGRVCDDDCNSADGAAAN